MSGAVSHIEHVSLSYQGTFQGDFLRIAHVSV